MAAGDDGDRRFRWAEQGLSRLASGDPPAAAKSHRSEGGRRNAACASARACACVPEKSGPETMMAASRPNGGRPARSR